MYSAQDVLNITNEILNEFARNGFLKFYQRITLSKVSDKIRFCCLLINDEIEYSKNKRIYNLDAVPDNITCCLRVVDFYHTNWVDRIKQEKDKSNNRQHERNSIRYQKLKGFMNTMFPVKFCFKCNSRKSINMDHIKNHYSFRFPDLAYSVDNLQWLCNECNLKKKSGEDYRTEEQKMIAETMMKDFLNGDPVIK